MLFLLWACASGEPSEIQSSEAEDTGSSPWDLCASGATDGRLDIERACADALCLGMTGEEVFAALGEPDEVTAVPHSSGTRELVYTWASGLETGFWDNDLDDVPDEGDVVMTVGVNLPWDGGTSLGLGLGATWACFLEQLGTPDYPLVDAASEPAHYTWATWSGPGVDAEDALVNADPDGYEYGTSDGQVDEIRLHGPRSSSERRGAMVR